MRAHILARPDGESSSHKMLPFYLHSRFSSILQLFVSEDGARMSHACIFKRKRGFISIHFVRYGCKQVFARVAIFVHRKLKFIFTVFNVFLTATMIKNTTPKYLNNY